MESNYANIDRAPELAGQRFDGILLDLGVSSHQVDDASRGFTFRPGAPLDMRMGADAYASAADLLNRENEATLTGMFKEFGDEPRGARLAREVVRRRATTSRSRRVTILSGRFAPSSGPRSGPADFARLFQAVRIAVNNELMGLTHALPALRDRLSPGGTLVGHRLSLGRGSDREEHVPRLERGLHLPAEAADMYLSRTSPWNDGHSPGAHRVRGQKFTAIRALEARVSAHGEAPSSRPAAVGLCAGARWFRLGDDGRHCTESFWRSAGAATFAPFSASATLSQRSAFAWSRRIRDASSRARLQPIAEQRLNMHIPKPDQQIFLPRPAAGEAPRAKHDSL